MEFLNRIKGTIDAARTANGILSGGGQVLVTESKELFKLMTEVEGYRMLAGGALDDDQHKLRIQQQASYALWRKNLLAQRLIEVNIDFVVGDGLQVVAKHDDEATKDAVQEVVDNFWNDPINSLDDEIERIATEFFLWGEVCIPVTTNPVSGGVRLGWVTPIDIMDVHPDPVTGQPGMVEVSDRAASSIGTKKLKVIAWDDRTGLLDGECFYVGNKRLAGNNRGVPELAAALSWTGVLDATLKSIADRAEADSAFVWDVMLKGKSDTEIKQWVQTYWSKPRAGAVRAHNEFAEIKAVAPNLNAADTETHINTIRTHILGGYGFPLHWFGSGADANLATASVMAEPTRKTLKRKQRAFRRLIAYMIWYAVGRAVQAGTLKVDLTPGQEPFEVIMPDLSGPDMAKAGAAIQSLTAALAVSLQSETISQETAIEVTASAYAAAGVEIDPAQERERIDGEAEKRKAKEDEEMAAAEQALQARMQDMEQAQGDSRAGLVPPQAEG